MSLSARRILTDLAPREVLVPTDVALLASNTPSTLEQLSDRYSDRAYRVAGTILACEHAATDVFGDACLELWGTVPGGIRPRPGVGTWLMGTVSLLAVEARADGRGHPGLLSVLDDQRCRIVAMTYYGRSSLSAISGQLQIPEDVVASELSGAMAELAETLDGRADR